MYNILIRVEANAVIKTLVILCLQLRVDFNFPVFIIILLKLDTPNKTTSFCTFCPIMSHFRL